MTTFELTPTHRGRFALLSDVLIPRALGMPAASDVDISGDMLDHVLELRPDLITDFQRGIDVGEIADAVSAEQAANTLNESDPGALTAIGVVASAIYYMNPQVRKLLNYPGQTSHPVLPEEEDDWQSDPLLDPVVKRGPIFRAV